MRRGRRAADRLGLLVDQEDPVGVAVEGQARRRRPSRGRGAGGRPRFSGWIGSAGWFGKVPSSSGYRISTSKGRPSKTLGTTKPPMPLAVSATILRGRSDAEVDERAHVVDPLAHQVDARRSPPASPAAGSPRSVRHRLDLDAGRCRTPIGLRAGEAELDAVVLGGVVRGGEHRAGRVEVPGGEVEEVGRGQAEVDDLDAHARARPRRRPRTARRPTGACRAR